MKKIITILASALVLSAAANAQETFYPGWNYGLQVGASYTAGQGEFGKLVSVPTIGLNAGYEFTGWFGLRGNLSGWQAKGIQSDAAYKFNYVQLSADAIFDICNIFKYRSERFLSPYIFLGGGLNYRFNNGAPASDYAWAGSVLGAAGRAGLGFNFRCSDAVKISLEVVDNILANKFNSVEDSFLFKTDHNLSAFLGVKFTFGQAKKKADAIAAAAAAEAARLAAEKAAREKAEADRLAAEKAAREKAEAERLAAERAAREAAEAEARALAAAKAAVAEALDVKSAYPRFIIGKYSLTKETKNKVAVASEILKANPKVGVTLTGYADKETGSAKGNMKLSEKRANAIYDALVAAGVDAKQLTVAYKGDTEVPFEGAKPTEKRTVTFKVD